MIDTTIIALVMGFGVSVLALTRKPPLRGLYTFYGGLVWLFSSLFVFPEYDDVGWVILTSALGLFLIIEGALEVMEVK
jgi:hypothetical protein